MNNRGVVVSSPISALIFDLDGTLIDSTPGIQTSLVAAFEAAGRTMPAKSLRTVIGPPIGVIARRMEPSLTDSEVSAIERTYRSLYDTDGWRETHAFPSVVDTLTDLHSRGLQQYIVTNKPRTPTLKILANLSLNELFLEALTRDTSTPPYNSKADMVADILDRRNLQQGCTLMIGDTLEDQDAAYANGLKFLHVTYGYGSVPAATHSIDRFSEIIPFLWETRLNRLVHRGINP